MDVRGKSAQTAAVTNRHAQRQRQLGRALEIGGWQLGDGDWWFGTWGLVLGTEDWAWSWRSQEESETDAVDVRGKNAQTAAVTNRHAKAAAAWEGSGDWGLAAGGWGLVVWNWRLGTWS